MMLGCGFLWNNPGVGRAVLGKNVMSFEAYSTRPLDYWVVAGDAPAEIEEAYAAVTVEPDPVITALYKDLYQQFRQIYPTCKSLFRRLL